MASYLGRGAASNGTVYVSNLPPGTSETMLADFFGTIGLLKVGILPCSHVINLCFRSSCSNVSFFNKFKFH